MGQKRKRGARDPALDSRREDGFYAHVLASPPRELLRAPSRAGSGEVLVVEYGPWRVLWLQAEGAPADAADADFFQGVTYHEGGALSAGVVGFDYQRCLVAAALPFLFGEVANTPASQRPVAYLVGLGAGCCAAALAALSCGRFSVHVAEIDRTIAEASALVHGVRMQRVDAAESACEAGGEAGDVELAAERVLVSVADAKDHVRNALAPGSLRCVLLDAYDSEGNVPATLQTTQFISHIARALAPGGVVLANVWRVDPAERRASDAFARKLGAAVGPVFVLQVPARDGNLVLAAVKGGGGASPVLEGVRTILRRAADDAARPGAPALEPEMLACLRSNVTSLRRWGDWGGAQAKRKG